MGCVHLCNLRVSRAKSRIRLSDFTFTFHFHALEKEMATHSSVLAWRIPGTGKPGGLPSMGSRRVGHDCSDLEEEEVISKAQTSEGISYRTGEVKTKHFQLINIAFT